MTFFLTVDDVIEIHADGLSQWGGLSGIRDLGLLESAVAMPEQYLFGNYVHESLFDKAAAYGFHIAQNQPFVDGNKRAAAGATLMFLEANEHSYSADVNFAIFSALAEEIPTKVLDKSGLSLRLAELTRIL